MEALQTTSGVLNVLRLSVGSRVKVKVRDGSRVRGILRAFDEHLNLLLNKSSKEVVFVRGDVITYIRPKP